MNWREMSKDDKRSQSPSLRRRTSEPRVEENRHSHSHWFSASGGPVTNGREGSSVRDHYNGRRLYDNHKDEHFRKLSQFCENLEGESPSKKFRWENLFAKNPANATSKSSLGLEHVNGCDDGDNRGIRVSGSHLGAESSFKDNNNSRTFHLNIGASKDSNVNNGDISRSFGRDDCSHLSSSRKFDGPVYKNSDVDIRDRSIFEEPARNSHREGRNGTSSHGIEASHPHSSARITESRRISQDEFHGFYEGRLPLTSTDSTWKREKHREPVETELNMDYKQARSNHIEKFDDCNQYFKVQQCKRSSPFSQQMIRIPQDDFYQDSTRTSVVMDPVNEGFEESESYVVGEMEEIRPSDHYDLIKEPFIIEGSYMGNAPYAMEQDRKVFGSESEAYINSREKLLLAEEDDYRTNYGKWSHEDGLNGSLVSNHEQDLSDMEVSRKMRWRKAAHSTKPSLKGTRCGVHYPGSDSARKSNVFSRIQFLSHGDEKSAVKDIDNGINLNSRNKRWNDEGTSISLNSSKRGLPWVTNQASPRLKSKRRDLKNRLGISLKDPSSNPVEREQEGKRNKRLRKTNVNHDRCLDVQAGDSFEEKTQSPTSRPLKDSKEGNQLIKSAFLKFVKVLSENPARRKKFTEPGCGIIKCIVCGSKSEEFADALSLSQHAFQSLEGSSRVEHLGLHKALCWLMGWSSKAAPNGLWVGRILPLVEVLSLKEDLIIWPPVLIIHNSSIAIDNTSDRVPISCEELEVVIQGMGCEGKIKAVRGKPGNQSIMVATFGAMLSGLQEAERLHKSFADKSHGRNEFQNIINSSHLIDNSHKDLHKAAEANPMESILYGYLGLAEDLDKLDFETKKRSVVKSKKEIQAIVDASLHC